jgi:peroxiredoxin
MKCVIVMALFAVLSLQCRGQSNPSTLADEQFKRFMTLRNKLLEEYESDSSTNAADNLARGARVLQKEFPTERGGYQLIMIAVTDHERSDLSKARALAQEMSDDSSAPDTIKKWARGFLHRLDCREKPIALQFVAVDGREVDLARMRGKVVLVDFWATWCGPCVREVPRLKAAFEKFHSAGFEVVGISCDTDRMSLERFLEREGISWSQFFDGQTQIENSFAQAFGINGIPHMFLVDRNGHLRVDNVRANGDFEKQIADLLAEPGGAANGSQPLPSETKPTPSAAVSRR